MRIRDERWLSRAAASTRRTMARTLGVCGLLTVAAACASNWQGSIGALLAKDNRSGRLFVRDVPADMAGARAGLRLGDEVTAIDGKPVGTMGPDEVQKALRGKVGSKVTLTIARGEERRDVVVERGPFAEELPR